MDTVTRTFPVELTSNYVPGTVIELSHFRDMVFDSDERVAVYLESFFCNLNLKSFNLGIISEFEGNETEAEKMAKFSANENRSQKIGLRILTRKNNIGNWLEKAEIILINRGRKDYFDLLQPYLAKTQVRIFEKNDAIGVSLIDYGNGLLTPIDNLGLEAAFTITIGKKNDTEALQVEIDALRTQISTLELAIDGRLTNLPSNSLLGRNLDTGIVEIINQSKFATPTMLDQAIIDLVGGAPGALNTLKELASALNNNASFAADIINLLSEKAPLSNPIFTGTVATNGVQFPSIQIPSTNPRMLDDYEEGLFTPNIVGTTTLGTTTNYLTRQGSFTKIGRRVFIECFVEWTGHDGTGNLSLSGLPYVSAITKMVGCWHRNLSLSSNSIVQTYISAGQSIIVFKQSMTGTSVESNIPIDVAAGIMISGNYLTTN